MSKTELKAEQSTEKEPYFVTSDEMRGAEALSKLVKKHGKVFINVKGGVPLKITQVELK